MIPEHLRKAAVLVAALDSAGADALLERLPPEQAALVRRTLVELPDVAADEEAAVIAEFFGRSGDAAPTVAADVEFAPSSAATNDESGATFEFLHAAPVEDLGELLAGERPQVVAVVVSHLPAEQAARVVAALPYELQTEVVRRLARLDETDPTILREVEAGLARRFHRRFPLDGRRTAGVGAVKRIFDEAEPALRRQWLTNLSQQDPRLAANLTQPTFTFADLSRLADDSWRLLLDATDEAIAIAALAGAEPEFAADVARRLPRADARRLQQAIDTLGPTRLSDLDAAQDELVRIARELELQGRLEWRDADEPADVAAAA